MEVFAFVGPSGSGKSHRALLVARACEAEVIVDDGLLIQGERILAGVSAKRQLTRVGAIKAALFTNPEQVAEAKAKLSEANPTRLLIIGTSVEMVNWIAQRLEIPSPQKIISIEEVASPQEITRAKLIRKKYGKHVVPAPQVEVRPRVIGTIIEPLRVFFRPPANPVSHPPTWLEQTVVRPPFSFYGKISVSEQALTHIVWGAARHLSPCRVLRVRINSLPAGLVVDLEVALTHGFSFPPLLSALQSRVKERLEFMAAIPVKEVNVTVKRLIFPEA